MTFSEELRVAADDVFEGIFQHPFVTGLGKGNLKKEAIIHYVKADFEYLNAFINIYGLAISKSDVRDEMNYFYEQIGFVLHSEIHPHNNLCEVAGVSYDELQGYPLPPTADHYVTHMKTVALQGSIGELIAALLPCPWTYLEIGHYLMKKYKPQENHPFYDWISFYAQDETASVTTELRKRLDKWAEEAGETEKQKAKLAFMKSCQLEYLFWEMAYQVEEWPFSLKGTESSYA
ncbi:thiaminase II [Gracilibacillus caseinilyticus]|uniref:Aminopyrimidine aminohydrolase n=1 Tax=Gracilibacillus caseinilyticus TaxID=2932256 RepID=A0ABY4EZV5_9BACI|nr:thiaminase II [Gracilibacillus caseinilyticus]UOQ49184.1 thiaminase II [Gracilibacillus caseinilyticus]